jgi:hypothetical protein
LAALVILGTILAGMVMAKARHTRQIVLTQQRQVALRLADQLINRWWMSPQGVPINQRGALEGDVAWTWETRVVENTAIENLGGRVVRVEVRPAQTQEIRPSTDDETLIAVELVLPDPNRLPAPAEETAQDKATRPSVVQQEKEPNVNINSNTGAEN